MPCAGTPVCLLYSNGLNEMRLNECVIKSTDTCLGSAVCTPGLGGLLSCLPFEDTRLGAVSAAPVVYYNICSSVT